MRKLFLLSICALLLVVLFSGVLSDDPGRVIISYAGTTFAMTFWFFMLLLLGGYFLLSLLQAAIKKIVKTGDYRLWNSSRVKRKAQRLTSRGLIALAEGRWEKAYRSFTQAGDSAPLPLLNYIGSACSAYQLGKNDEWPDYLQKARLEFPKAELAIGIIQARLQLSNHQYEQALATSLHLHEKAISNIFVLSLLKRIYIELKDWEKLTELLPLLRKYKALPEEKLAELESTVYAELLRNTVEDKYNILDKEEALQKLWKKIPKYLQKDSHIIASYATQLMAVNCMDKAEAVIVQSLKQQWHDELIEIYGKILGTDVEKQLLRGEQWLKERPNHLPLMLSLGRLSLYAGQLDKAQSYLEAYAMQNAGEEVYTELSLLYMHKEETEKSLEYFQKALQHKKQLPVAV